jgi:SagB-type dehydrogenase family enzyme
LCPFQFSLQIAAFVSNLLDPRKSSGLLGEESQVHDALATVHRYHDGTKHHFQHFARSLGYLDWASQPRPFRTFAGAPMFPLYPAPGVAANDYAPRATTYRQLFSPPSPAEPLGAAALGDVLRHALGLSAWKRFDKSRWSLRVNPSSGNLHPTEAYIVCGAAPGLADTPAVYHYAADRHALEQRCAFDGRVWASADGADAAVVLVALTSIHWREAWKYGERAFRYCQHDLGHAIGAISLAAALARWRAVPLSAWSHRAIATLTGVDRDEDFVDAEREEPGCVIALCAPGARVPFATAGELVTAVSGGQWSGRASQLSEEHVEWTFIDEIARATGTDGTMDPPTSNVASQLEPPAGDRPLDARSLILQRRSAVAFDGRSTMARSAFFDMMSRVMAGAEAPWHALWWTPRIHLAIFVHRVDSLAPGLYLLARDSAVIERLRTACGREFLWEAAHDSLPLFCLARGACQVLAARLSCDQSIAADGYFSLGMIAEFDASLDAYGASFYRNLFWESGVIGQVLYLDAEAAGARATGIGCFYDDPVHDTLGLQGHAFQSLYHFTVGIPVEDGRLTTEPGYAWEKT